MSEYDFFYLYFKGFLELFDDSFSVFKFEAESFSISDFCPQCSCSDFHRRYLQQYMHIETQAQRFIAVVSDRQTESRLTALCGLSESYSPSCIAVAILFMVAITTPHD